MDGSTSRKSDAAATRKRRSSILKSQRYVRAPLSELEFNVATPDQTKSRRVSFSRRTGVAEFEVTEATTAWKNVYEEHNKSLETSANESGVKAAPRRVGHLGARSCVFQDEEADLIDVSEPRAPPTAQLDELPANTNTTQLFRLDSNPGLRELTDKLDVDLSAVAPLADDLELLARDLQRGPKRANISEISIDVDFNATHFSLKVDNDDMSITDTIRSPAVCAAHKQVDDWTADKENIVVNPYIAPPPAEFSCEDILVFDGKKCKFQSKLDQSAPLVSEMGNIPPNTVFLDDMTETQAIPVNILQENILDKSVLNTERRRTVVFGDDGDMSVTQAVASNIIAPKAVQEDKENQKTMYFNDLADMSVTQALPADIIENEPQLKTILYEDDAHISMTEAVPARVLAGLENLGLENKRRTIVNENADVSTTGVVSGRHEVKGNEDRRKTIVYGNDDGNISITGVLPANIIDEAKLAPPPNTDRRKTIVYGNDNGNLSVTGVLPTNIIDEAKLTQLDTDRRRTVVFGNDDGNLSMTGVAPVNILDGAKVTQGPNTDRRKTIVYHDDDGNVSMTGVLPANIIDEAKVQQPIDRRKTIVYDNDDGNVSVTEVLPANIIDEAKVSQQSTDRRKTVVFENDDGNLSMTGVAPMNILDGAKDPNTDRRTTIVYRTDGGNISITGVVPANIFDGSKVTQDPGTDRRKTIVYNNDEGNISVTGVVPGNIFDVAKEIQEPNADRRKTILHDNDQGNISVTSVPVNILDEAEHFPTDPSKTVEYDKNDGNVTKPAVLLPILDDGTNMQPLNAERRKTVVYDEDNGNLSMTAVAPVNILDGANKQNTEHKTIVNATDDGNLSLTVAASELFEDANEQLDEPVNAPNRECRKTVVYGDNDNNVPANIIEEEAKLIQSLNEEHRKTTVYRNEDVNVSMAGVTQANIIDEENDKQQPKTNRESIVYGNIPVTGVLLDKEDVASALEVEMTLPSNADCRKTVVYEENDGNMSITGVIPNIIDEAKSTHPIERRKTVVYEDNDVSMTDIVPANIMPEDNIVVPETQTSFICENTETQKNELQVFDEKVEQVEMIEIVTIPKVIESDEVGDVSMTQADGPQSPKNLCSTTLNKSLTNQDITSLNESLVGQIISAMDNTTHQTFDQPLADQRSATINKSLAGQTSTVLEKSFPSQEQSLAGQVLSTTFNKDDVTTTLEKSLDDPHSATFNKSLANQEPDINKSLPGQEYVATLNRSLAGQNCPTITKSLTGHSTSMNKTLTSNILVYGATTGREAKGSEASYLVEGLNLEHNQSQESSINPSLVLSKSSTERLARSRVEAVMTPPKESVLDVLLDMSQASGEDMWKPPSNTVTEPVSNITVTVTDSISTSESYILVKDDEPDEPALEVTEPLAIEYKKQKHGIVCKLQRKLSELKDTLLIKQKSPKKEKNKNENQDLTQNTSNLDTPKTTDSFEKSKLPKPSLMSPSSPKKDVQEKNKSVKIDLTSEMSVDEEVSQVENQIQVDLTSIEDKEQADTTKCQANDTKAILDALSDFTDTRRSGDFEPAPNPDKTRRSSAPDRKSMVISREDLLREISMAQALMKTEMAQTEIELDATEGSSDDQEHSPPRLSGEVVKTLRFEDDESILDSKILQKPLSPDSPPFRTSSVIPTYEISDPVKELMKDLIQPLADVEQPSLTEPCQSSQADHLDSSQIDLIPAKPILVSPRSCLRKNEQEVAHSEMHVESPRREPEPVIVFDPSNPLNNVVIPPLDRAVVHKYNPVPSGHSLSPSTASQCCQTDGPEPRSVEVGLVLARPTVDRGVASGVKLGGAVVDRAVSTSATVKDCEVNTTIVMKGNRELLAESSSLTLVDDVLPRSPVRVIFKLDEPDEPDSSVVLDSDLSSVHDSSDNGRKRGHVAAKGPEVTPKPAMKVQKVSNSTKVSRRPRSQSPRGNEIKDNSPSSRGSSVTVAQLYACARGAASASATDSRCSRVSDWRPELLHEASSKNLVAEQESGVNVVAKIDVLPFMGTSECEWESRAADTWTFRLLRAQLRLLIRLEHRATNTTRVLVRADTPVRLVTVQHVAVDQDRTEPVAALCLCLAAEAMRRLCGRGVARAGAVPALLRRCAAVARVALHWGRCMRQASAALAFSLSEDGCLSLKVANIPLRSIWEITLRISLLDDGRGAPHPRAAGVAVAPVVAAWAPGAAELRALLHAVPEDWGHVPRTVWKLFKYLKNKRPEDDLLVM